MWIHNECLFISEDDYENVLTTGCTWICPKCDFFNFSDSFFDDQLNLRLMTDWLVGCFGFSSPLRQYFSLYRAVSQKEGERGEKE